MEQEREKQRDELVSLQHKFNNEAREHSKTGDVTLSKYIFTCMFDLDGGFVLVVVTLRQLERQRERERERAQVQLVSEQQKHETEVTKLEQRLREAEHDRNLLLVSGFFSEIEQLITVTVNKLE